MNAFNLKSLGQLLRRRPWWLVLGGVALLGLAAVAVSVTSKQKKAATTFQVQRGDFLISVVEAGTLEAVNEVVIRNEVEGVARIIYIVPEGSLVKKGDLLVRLDSSAAEDQVNQQRINHEKAKFALTQAEQQLDIQKSVFDSEMSAANLKVEFAQTDLKKYMEGESLQERRDAQIKITNVLENLKIAEERLRWTVELEKLGFETKNNLDKDRLTVSQTSLSLEQAQKALELIEVFDYPKKKRTLESALEEAKEQLGRVKLQGERRIAQYEADVTTQRNTLELSAKKLAKDEQQLAATKILAPQDGLVVYASGGGGGRFSSESMIEEGATVRNRQELIKLPDISTMKVNVKIHETYINQIEPGLPAFVVLDSMPDKRFMGEVVKVAPLPDMQSRWSNPNLKVYATEIVVNDKLPEVKPGVSARAEVVITNLSKVLTVPIQAVTTLRGKQVVYLARAEGSAPVPVTVGQYNTRFIEVTSGVKEGDHVLLAPPADTSEKDLGGSILGQGEEMPKGNTTNTVSRRVRNGMKTNLADTAGAAATAPSGDRQATRGPGQSGNRPAGMPSREEMMKRFDKDGDGQLSEEERTAMREAMAAQFGNRQGARGEGQPGAAANEGQPEGARSQNRPNREEMMKRFDKNGDGQLDDEERAAMREVFGNRPRRDRANQGEGGATNAPPSQDSPQPAREPQSSERRANPAPPAQNPPAERQP